MKIRLTKRGKELLKKSSPKTGRFIPRLRKPRYREYTLIEFNRENKPIRQTKIIIDENKYFRTA